MHTAFCSYHESTSVSGRSFTPQSNASASARAIFMAEYASLHCPQSSILGMPSIVYAVFSAGKSEDKAVRRREPCEVGIVTSAR